MFVVKSEVKGKYMYMMQVINPAVAKIEVANLLSTGKCPKLSAINIFVCRVYHIWPVS